MVSVVPAAVANNLATAYLHHKRLEDARVLLEEVSAIRHELFGESLPVPEAATRRPFIRTRVRLGPMPLRLSAWVPSLPAFLARPVTGCIYGSLFRYSSSVG